MLRRLFSRSRFDARSHDLYDALVAQARQPGLYSACGVPDTLDGRFDAVVLHAALVMRRLRRCGPEGEKAAQRLFDLMFADFDRTLREIGVGDLRVGKRIKQMAQAFYGRAKAYDAALDKAEEAALAEALLRNLYGGAEPGGTALATVAAYARRQEDHLAELADDDLLAGRVSFAAGPLPAPPAAAI